MPGPQIKRWDVYHKCMEGKSGSEEDKTYCAKVANAVAEGTIRHSSALADIVRYGIEQALKEAPSKAI